MEQRLRLESEGVRFLGARVDMQLHGWEEKSRKPRSRRLLATGLLAVVALAAQSTVKRKSGLPDPPKKDVPYIIHAANLVETDIGEAKEETRKDEMLYYVPGAAAQARTPLAGPEFLFDSDAISPEKLALYRMEPKGGRREVVVMRKKKPVARPVILSIFKVHEKVVKIRVDESLESGEYCLSPDGSNAVFCFGVD